MADVEITSEITLDADGEWLARLRAEMQEMDKVLAPRDVVVGFTLASTGPFITQFDAVLADLKARAIIPVELVVNSPTAPSGGAGSNFTGGGPGFSAANSFNSFNTTNTGNFEANLHQQQANLFQQVDASLTQSLTQMFASYSSNVTNITNNTPAAARAASAVFRGSPDAHVKAYRQQMKFEDMDFRDFVAEERETAKIARAEERAVAKIAKGREQLDSHVDAYRQQLPDEAEEDKATPKPRPRGGRLGGALGRYLGPGILIHEALRSGQAMRDYQSASALSYGDNEGLAKADLDFHNRFSSLPIVGQLADLATDPTGARKGGIEAELRRAQAQDEVGSGFQRMRAESLSERGQLEVNGVGGFERQRREAAFRERQRDEQVDEERNAQSKFIGKQENIAIGAAEQANTSASAMLGDSPLLNAAPALPALAGIYDRITGFKDDGGAAKRVAESTARNERDINEKRAAEARKDASEKSQQERDDISRAESADYYHQTDKRQGIADSGEFAQLRMGGKTREAGDREFSSGLQREIDLLTKLSNNSKDPIEATNLQNEAKERTAVMPALLEERKQREDAQEKLEQAQSSGRISEMQTGVQAAGLRAAGDTRDAGNLEYAASLERRVQSANAAYDAEQDGTKKQLRLNELLEARADQAPLLAARKAEQDRQEQIGFAVIQDRGDAMGLQLGGRNREAANFTRNRDYERRIRELRDNGRDVEAEGLEQEQGIANQLEEKRHKRGVDDLNAQADDKRLRNQGNRGLADVLSINRRTQNELRDNSGDPDKQRAILRNESEDIDGFIKGETMHPNDRRSAYMQLLGAVMDPGRRKAMEAARNAKRNNQAEQRAIDHGLDPLTGKPINPHAPINAGAQAIGDAMAKQKADAITKFSDTTDKLSNIADRILSAPTLITLTA